MIPTDSTTISGNDVRCIFEDRQNNLWIGTRNGLNLMNRDRREFIQFLNQSSDSSTINDNTIRSITEDRKGRLWIGSGKGLNKLIPSPN